MERYRLDLCDSEQGAAEGSSEYGNEPTGYIKYMKFLDT
jgi:hypothetical protein